MTRRRTTGDPHTQQQQQQQQQPHQPVGVRVVPPAAVTSPSVPRPAQTGNESVDNILLFPPQQPERSSGTTGTTGTTGAPGRVLQFAPR